jgi:hypothetical protein
MARIKISELPELNIATLDTTFVVGSSGSATYKIPINRLTSSLDTTFASDLVVNAVSGTINTLATTASLNSLSTSIDNRLDGLESFSSSADNRYVLSGSITQTTWDNIANKPNDIVSSSTQISDLGFVTGSYTTITSFNNLTQSFNQISQSFTTISGSFDSIDFSGINAITESYLTFTQSYYSASASFDSKILIEKNRIDAILSASNTNTDTFAEIVTLINSVDLTNDNAFASFYTASNTRITSLENATSSYLTSLNGAISSSTQVLNGSGIYSSSAQLPSGLLSSSLGFVSTASYTTDSASFNSRIISGSAVAGTISGSSQISALGFITSSQTINTSSFATTGSNSFSGSQTITGSLIVSAVAVVNGGITIPTGSILSLTSGSSISVDASGSITGSLTGSVFGIGNVVSFSQSVDNRLDTLETTIISGSPNYTQVLGNRRTGITSAGTSIISGSITTTGNPVQIMVTGDANPIGGSGWARLQIFRDGNGIGNIIQVENSSNLNVPYCLNVIDTPSAGTYSYSMRTVDSMSGTFDFGEFNGPLLTAVELKTNTNLPSTNNVFTGTNRFNGQVTIGGTGGDEGGELQLVTAQTNTTLTGSYASVDIYRDRLRIFEGGGTFRGVHVDLSKAPDGVAGELIWKTSGFVNAGTFLTLDNLKVSVTTGGSRGLSVGAVSTNFTANISGWFGYTGGGGGASAVNIGYTTTGSSSAFGWSFTTEGDGSNYIINDKTNNRVYRVTLMIGAGYNNNFISIERLY